MPKDVEMLFYNGTWRIKAITDRAKEAMGKEICGAWPMARDVYWQSIDDSKLPSVISKLKALGLTTEDNDDELFSF